MPTRRKPIVYLSYRWVDIIDQDRPGRGPDPKAGELADKLRSTGIDVRFDLYCLNGLYGYRPPQRVPGDALDPWLRWATAQVAEADVVLLYCTPDYVNTDPHRGRAGGAWWQWSRLDEPTRIRQDVPGLWWDWLAISQECDAHPQKFIPIGPGPYHGDQIPEFLRGASYINMSEGDAFETVRRRIRQIWHERVPRTGVFISYSHKDDKEWLDQLYVQFSWLRERHGVKFWSDRDIEPGDRWHNAIQEELDCAKVALLLVSSDFLASSYIQTDELPAMLRAAESDGMKIFWIPVRDSPYRHSPIAEFQAAHSPQSPMKALSAPRRDRAWVEIGEKLARVLGVAE